MSDDPDGILPKPDALLALHDVTAELFARLREWFGVPDEVTLDLSGVDSAVGELGDPLMVAALAMRKLQALHLLSTPGVRTTTDVVVTIVQDLDRALIQAPSSRLRVQAETTDWDAEFAALDEGKLLDENDSAPVDADEVDPEVERFRMLHAQLHRAARAVLEASEGRIRIFE
ncbi:MAG TPA: hypothetical protein VIL36_09920 [Acidimicrobiales bacterium]